VMVLKLLGQLEPQRTSRNEVHLAISMNPPRIPATMAITSMSLRIVGCLMASDPRDPRVSTPSTVTHIVSPGRSTPGTGMVSRLLVPATSRTLESRRRAPIPRRPGSWRHNCRTWLVPNRRPVRGSGPPSIQEHSTHAHRDGSGGKGVRDRDGEEAGPGD